jgi:hypothetical protein
MGGSMNTKSYVFALLLCTLALSAVPAHAAGCDPVDGAEFICGVRNPEDLIRIPDSRWVLVSSMGEGHSHLYAVDSKSRIAVALFPDESAHERWDKKTYGSCPGPLAKGKFDSHGVDLRPGAGGVSTVYVVNHEERESIEVFELKTAGKAPTVTWVGCAVLPAGASGNGVVGLPGGGFVATNFKDPRDPKAFEKMGKGEVTGNVQEWHSASGWTALPDSAMSGANGLALSKDGKSLYVAGWPGKKVTRFERTGKTWAKRDSIATGILTDNLRWMRDGSLLASGQDGDMPAIFACRPPGCYGRSGAVKIDTRTGKTTRIVNYAGNASFEGSTTTLDMGNELWLGSYRGDRLAILKAK